MKVSLSLSSKTDESGMSEILLKMQNRVHGKVNVMRAKSNIFIQKVYFCPESGIKNLSKRHVETPDVKYHREKAEKLTALMNHILNEYQQGDKEKIKGDWLSEIVDRYNFPEKYIKKEETEKKSIYELFEIYIQKKQFSMDHTKGYRVLARAISRYEGFVQATENKNFKFDYETIKRETIEDFSDYLRNEKDLSEEYPVLFGRLLNNYPANIKKGYSKIEGRGGNAVVKMMKKLKAFFAWLRDTERTENRPFEGFVIGSEKFGTPYYISIEERNIIASKKMPTKHLETQRDIFIFQCLIGCRVGDLYRLNAKNVQNGVLSYTPNKTKNEGEQAIQATIPLVSQAVSLIKKYNMKDAKGRLFPFISTQKYNDAIKEIFTLSGITRNVEVRNGLTGEIEIRPINEVASSHMARRTFVGNLYFKVQDPSLICAMSGHVEGSQAFNRYRKIETSTLKELVKNLE